MPRVVIPLVLALLVPASIAHAGRRGGDPGGGGRLGQVNSGLASAGHGQQGGGQAGPVRDHRDEGELYTRETRGDEVVIVATDGTIVRRIAPTAPPASGPARIDLFVGVQKVHGSDQSGTMSIAIADRWLRLAGSVTQYQEQQMDGSQQALTVPTALLGVRLGTHRATRAYLEAGVVVLRTHGVRAGDVSWTGSVIGIHVEHRVGRGRAVIGDAHAMMFEDGVRATSARLGVRAGVVEAGFRVFDVNVGPALLGPEVGLRF